jgi:predicted membrane-bound spermidine synthase
VLVVSGIAGACTMVLELAAVRLLAPWFGTSLVVWTNVIAVILLALAMGYFLGGRLASQASPLFILSWMLLIAGAVVAWIPHFCASLAVALLPEEIALQEAAGLVGWGSLALAVVAFLPPATLLGTACPLAVEGLARARGLSPGRAGGLVLFVSNLGSLVGVFGTSHLLLPLLGLQRTFLLVSVFLLLAGGLALALARHLRSRRPALLGILAVCTSSAFVVPSRPPLRAGLVELDTRESAYQSLRVVEDRTTATPLRFLQINEGFDSFQSVWQPQPGLLPPGFYYNDFLLPLSWREDREPWNVFVLGLGAGTVARVFQGESLDSRMIGVEIDPAVVELGRAFFDLSTGGEMLSVWSGIDARVALRVGKESFEQVVLDCYANQVEIPHHLCTLEFFQSLRDRLVDGGWLTANLGGFDFQDPVVASVASTCANAFGSAVLLLRVPWSRNFLLLARRDGSLPLVDSKLQAATRQTILALGPRRLPGFARVVEPDSNLAILTDDWCPIENLQLRSLLEARALRRNVAGP